jgi:hypothetical protein
MKFGHRRTVGSPTQLASKHEREDIIEFWDGEVEGAITIYISDGIDRIEARTIHYDASNFIECTQSWMKHGRGFVDHRSDKSIALPTV